ncbi:MAG: response regulator, partial [Chloroflexota bacterium]
MAVPVLVITPSAGFGELICQILEETGSYALTMATSGAEALKVGESDQPAICILDADLDDIGLSELAEKMRQTVDNLLVVVIPQDDNKQKELDIQAVNADGILAKPFYLPDLVTKVEEVVNSLGKENFKQVKTKPLARPEKKQPASTSPSPAPEWLQDVAMAARHLTRLSLESASQASLITRQDQVWAYAGELPQPAVEELAYSVDKFYKDDGGGDLARFIHLKATGNEYMLYATGLGDDYVLAVVFDAEMPFSTIRSQAGKLATALANDTPPVSKDELKVENKLKRELAQEDTRPADSPLLDDVPPPIPSDWEPVAEPSPLQKSFLEELLAEDNHTGIPIVKQPYPAAPVNKHTEEQQQVEVALQEVEPELNEEQPSAEPIPTTPPDLVEETNLSTPMRDEKMAETTISKSHKGKITPEVKLEPVSPAVYNLTYACVLIPRFPEHHLTGNLGASVSNWISQLCLAFGWRMEHISLRPDYLEWLVNVPPATSPGYLMRIIRQHS